MGLFKKRSTDPQEMEQLRAEIASMSARLTKTDAAETDLRQTVHGLQQRLDTPISAPPTEPPPAPMPSVDPARLDELHAQVAALSERVPDGSSSATEADTVDAARLAEVESTMQRISERLDELDGRITSISTELANQITEMSGELDALGANEPATDEVVDELRDAQTRLAGEQARYQIAFRQDLADLADRLKRA